MAIKLFGFTLGKKDVVQVQSPEQPSFALPTESMDDGAVTITQNAGKGIETSNRLGRAPSPTI